MDYGSYIQIQKLEDELVNCQNENIRLQMIIDLQNIQKELKEKRYLDQEKQMEYLFSQIEKLKRLNQKSQNQGIKKEVDDSKAKEQLTRLNVLLND